MTVISLTDCCRLLAIDGKTLRHWLAQTQLCLQAHPTDARLKGLSSEHLRLLATAHHRSLTALPEELPLPAPPQPPPLPRDLLDLLSTLAQLPAQLGLVDVDMEQAGRQLPDRWRRTCTRRGSPLAS